MNSIKQIILIQKFSLFIQLLIIWIIPYFAKNTVFLTFDTFYLILNPRQHFQVFQSNLKRLFQLVAFELSEFNNIFQFNPLKCYYFLFFLQSTNMKFVIKSGSTVKLYSGDIKIEALAQFLKDNFQSWNSNNLAYTDSEGDKITLTSQQDLDTLIALNPVSKFIKLEIIPESQTRNPSPHKFQLQKIQEKQKLQLKNEESLDDSRRKRKKFTSKSLKKQERHSKKKEQGGKSKRGSKNSKKITSSENSQDESHEDNQLAMIEGIINQKVAEIVDQRINNLIPCIKNQFGQKDYVPVTESKQAIKHYGTICNGCNMTPITGIRYKCLKCPSFNFCAYCQDNIEHEHNLLKMKKFQSQQKKNINFQTLYKVGKKLFHNMKHHCSSSDEKNEHYSRRKRSWKKKHNFQNDEFVDRKMNKKLFKLRAIFGQQQDFKDFIVQHSDIRPKYLVDLYAIKKNIPADQLEEKRNQMRKQKLSAFYDCPENNFDEVVKSYPKLNFREIIMKLKQTGERTYSGENFKKMRQKFKQFRKEKTYHEESNEQSKKHSKSKEKKKQTQVNQALLKKEIQDEMSSFFGTKKNGEYSKFIDDNFKLGKEGIIAKWIENLSL